MSARACSGGAWLVRAGSVAPRARRPVLRRLARGVLAAAILQMAAMAGVTGAMAGQDDVFSDPPVADIVFLGEIHDNAFHHENQARAVEALHPAAIVFEMLTPELALLAGPQMRERSDLLAQTLKWQERGWPDFNRYYPIFTVWPSAAIYGGGVPLAIARQAMEAGAAVTFGEDADLFGLKDTVAPEVQAALEAELLAAHCDALPPELLPGMVEAQRLRDATIAQTALNALRETGGPVVVITGNGHARMDRAAPAMVVRADPSVSVVAIAQTEDDGAPPEVNPPYSAVVVTPAAPRADPCATFSKPAAQ